MNESIVVTPSLQSIQVRKLYANGQISTAATMLLLDFLALSLIFAITVLGRHAITPSYDLTFLLESFPCIAALLVAFGLQGLYPGVLLHPADEVRKIFLAVSTVFLLMACASFLWRNAEAYSRAVFLITWAIGAPFVLLVRRLSRRVLSRCDWWGIPAILIGTGPTAGRVLRTLRDGSLGVKLVGILSDNDNGALENPAIPILGPIASAPYFAGSKGAPIAILTTSAEWQSGTPQTIQDHCRGFAHVILVPDIECISSLGVSVRQIGGQLGLEIPQRLFHWPSAFTKRTIDLIVGSVALICLSPLFAALALGVRLSSKGDIFYGQKRCGRHGCTFVALKFRTMVPDADNILATYLAEHPELMTEWTRDHKLKNDPRITRIGKWMRRFSLDELPQLINVIAGQMSLIGPRPIVDAEIPKYGRCFELYSQVRPGMTGLWQVSGRNRTTYPERVALDEFYVNNWSIWLDLHILSRTVQVVLKASGAY
jgi:Undecaprenyl-phosphate galactose phosphotransferase WbaP